MKDILRQSTLALSVCLLSHSITKANNILTENNDSVASLCTQHDIQQSKQIRPTIVIHDMKNNQNKESHNSNKKSKVVKMKQVLEDIGSIFMLGLAGMRMSYTFYPVLGIPLIRLNKP